MIGNDIVDLSEAKQKSNWQRPRFLDKLFTPQEQYYISNADDPFLMVWRLWSMKESAYKLYTQQTPSRFYNPKKFQCEINKLKGKVCYKTFECNVKTKFTSEYILSESYISVSGYHTECIEINQNSPQKQSETLKAFLLSKVSEQLNIPQYDLFFKKSEFGVPSIYNYSKRLDIGVTISHHGNYGAYAFST